MNNLIDHFSCQRCGNCCRIKGIVRLSNDEIEALAKELNCPIPDFIEQYTDLSPDRKCLVLKNRNDDSCIFLTEENLCIVNNAKPNQCKTFPFEWTNPSSPTYCPALH